VKNNHRIKVMGSLLILLLLSGCGFFSGGEELSVQDLANTSVAETLEALHSIETIVALTLAAADTEVPTLAPTETPAPTDTSMPAATQTDVPAPTTAFTATSSVPMVSVSVATNCRVGPGLAYDQISVLLVGQQAEVVARSADGNYWVIRNPAGSGTCWLWGFYATVTGPTAGLPVWDPPPTPTPAATITNTPAPTTYKTGPLEIPQTYRADLDEGVLSSTSALDLWFEAVSSSEKYLTPRNGATFAVWGTSAPGMYDCIGASLSDARIPIASAPVGTYVCYRTNQGRPGVFRVNELSGSPSQTLKIGFTTWNAP